MYSQIRPCAELAADINAFWASEETPEEFNLFPIIPDSYIELVFNCGAPVTLVSENGAEELIPSVFLVGLQQKPMRLITQGISHILSVRCYAWSARTIVATSTPLPDQSFVPLDGVWKELARTLRHIVQHQGQAEALAYLQSSILQAYRRVKSDLMLPRTVGKLLYANNGKLNMSDLAENCYLSPSQFQRRMKQVLGLPTKTYARLIRYESARNALFRNPLLPIADIVHDYGYTDQAHLIHEFKEFTSRTPGELATYGMDYHAEWEHAGLLQYP